MKTHLKRAAGVKVPKSGQATIEERISTLKHWHDHWYTLNSTPQRAPPTQWQTPVRAFNGNDVPAVGKLNQVFDCPPRPGILRATMSGSWQTESQVRVTRGGEHNQKMESQALSPRFQSSAVTQLRDTPQTSLESVVSFQKIEMVAFSETDSTT